MATLKSHRFHQIKPNLWPWVGILLIIFVAGCLRIHLLQVPLERDEGEYAYAGQLMLQGIPPYAEVYTMKMPGVYVIYALILSVFGQTHGGIHFGLMIINLTTTILLFLLGKRLYDNLTGFMAGGSFAILSLSPSVQGIFANAEHFVILPAIGGILILLCAIQSNRIHPFFWSGLLFGIAFIMKQHGAAFILFGGLYLLYSQLHRRPVVWSAGALNCLIFLVGALIPFGATCLAFFWAGIFKKFWFWTFLYAREYVSSVPFSVGISLFKGRVWEIIRSAFLLWVLAGIGITTFLWDKKARSQGLFVVLFLLCSFVSVCPGLYFRPHYFIVLLPSVALLGGIAVSSMERFFVNINLLTLRKSSIILALVALLYSVYQQRVFLFQLSPTAIARMVYSINPFPESPEVAKFIKEHSSNNDRIAVIGSEPQIYFYSTRHAATGYIYTYALLEEHPYALTMQQEMISEIESARPKFLIFVNIPTSWLVRPGSEKLIFEWFNQYSQRYYDRVGVVDILSPQLTTYRWHDEAQGYLPRSRFWLAVFERKST